jgi:hypothetical protein
MNENHFSGHCELCSRLFSSVSSERQVANNGRLRARASAGARAPRWRQPLVGRAGLISGPGQTDCCPAAPARRHSHGARFTLTRLSSVCSLVDINDNKHTKRTQSKQRNATLPASHQLISKQARRRLDQTGGSPAPRLEHRPSNNTYTNM